MPEGLIIIGLIVLYNILKYIYRGYIKPYNLHELTLEDKKLLCIHRKNIRTIPYYYAKCNQIYKYCISMQNRIDYSVKFFDIGLRLKSNGYVSTIDECYETENQIYFTYLDLIVFESLYEHLFEVKNDVVGKVIEVNDKLVKGVINGRKKIDN